MHIKSIMTIPLISCSILLNYNFINLSTVLDCYLMNSSEKENTSNPIPKPTLPVICLSASCMLQDILTAVALVCLMRTSLLAAKLFFKLFHCERPRHLLSMINTVACNNHALQIPISQKNHEVRFQYETES